MHFLSDKNSFSEKLWVTYRTPCHAIGHLVFLVLHMLLVWHYTTQWLSGKHQCYLQDTIPCQWSTDLLQMLWIWESGFYSQDFFTLHSFLLFQGFPGSGSSNTKLAGIHADLRNIALAQLFVSITAIRKKVICGWFC